MVKKQVNAKIVVGDKFKLKCGTDVVVVEANNQTRLVAEDVKGERRICHAKHLRSGEHCWERPKPKYDARLKTTRKCSAVFPRRRHPKIDVGMEFETNSGDVVWVTEILDGYKARVTNSQGYLKDVWYSELRKGQVKMIPKQALVGKGFTLSCGVAVTITEVISPQEVRAEDLEGNSQVVNYQQLCVGNVRWWYGFKPEFGNLTIPLRYYVYAVFVGSEIVYIGSGTHHRYNHAISGLSNSSLLNKHFFTEPNTMDIIIMRDGMSKEHSLGLEKSMIVDISPRYNVQYNRHRGE